MVCRQELLTECNTFKCAKIQTKFLVWNIRFHLADTLRVKRACSTWQTESMNPMSAALGLTTANLKRSLEAGRAGRSLPDSPLQKLAVFVYSYGIAPAQMSKDVIDCLLLEWIGSLIETCLISQRSYYGMRTPRLNTRSEALEEFSLDFRQLSPELESWSVLYYRFVRVDLDLSWEQMGALTANTPRTLRRRQERGLRRLLSQIVTLDRQQDSVCLNLFLPVQGMNEDVLYGEGI